MIAFPTVIDSTMRSAFLACPQKFYLEFLCALRPLRPNVHLHFGACFARALEVARKTVVVEKLESAEAEGLHALIEAWGDFPNDMDPLKTLDTCVACYEAYLNRWPLDDSFAPQPLQLENGKPAVECRLRMELPLKTPDGQPIYYAGRFDALMRSPEGLILFCDEKTSKQLGKNWVKQWRMRGQFLGYDALAIANGFDCAGGLIRGVAPRSDGTVDLLETTILFPRWEVERWYALLLHDVERMLWHHQHSYWPLDGSGESCNAYGGCPYLSICQDADGANAPFVASAYRHEQWDPLAERPSAQASQRIAITEAQVEAHEYESCT